MNSNIECQQFNIKHEDNPLSVAQIKTEPQEMIKSEIKTESEECKHIDIKYEIQPILQLVPYVKIKPEVEVSQEILDKSSKDRVEKSQDEEENREGINFLFVSTESSENHEACIEEKSRKRIKARRKMGKYIRKEDSDRGNWSEDSLVQAMAAVREKKMGINEASRKYGIPSCTLRRRIIKNSTKKLGLGPYGILGFENELLLVKHIKNLELSGFALTKRDIQALAYSFSEKLGLEGKFSQVKKMAGRDWFRSFMQRHPDLSVRRSKGLPSSRTLVVSTHSSGTNAVSAPFTNMSVSCNISQSLPLASVRGKWSEDSLVQAVAAVREKKMGLNEASRRYGIPSRTLRRRIIKNFTKKLGMGPYGILGYENELLLVRHIKKLELSGFAQTSRDIRALAYSFSEKLGIKGKFNQVKKMAGRDWFRSFMQRHPDLSFRRAKGLSSSHTPVVSTHSSETNAVSTPSTNMSVSCNISQSLPSSTTSIATPKESCSTPLASQMETPNRILMEISPPPKLAIPKISVKRNIYSEILTSENCFTSNSTDVSTEQKTASKTSNKSVELTPNNMQNSGNYYDIRCQECDEYYYLTREECSWIKCVVCKMWLHENCTIFSDMCIECGREIRRKMCAKLKSETETQLHISDSL